MGGAILIVEDEPIPELIAVNLERLCRTPGDAPRPAYPRPVAPSASAARIWCFSIDSSQRDRMSFARQLRADHAPKDIPIIMLTAVRRKRTR